jgi:CRP/FNR family cyclic AMP-dependent transcriptional regulator
VHSRQVSREGSIGGFDRADNIGTHSSFPRPALDDHPTIRQLSALSTRRSYGNGAIVFSQADPGDALYGVVTGKIRISASSPDGREMFLNIMEPGDTFGEIALLDGRHRTGSASATVPSELIIITRDHFLEFLKHEPELVSHVVQLLCDNTGQRYSNRCLS